MLFFKRLLLLLLCTFFFGGCTVYHGECREFGDYYNTTKQLWDMPYAYGYKWMPEVKSCGQTIGLSGIILFFYGAYITSPIGFGIHYVEKVTLAPVVDTVYLPLDLINRSSYLEKEKFRSEAMEKMKGPKSDSVQNDKLSD